MTPCEGGARRFPPLRSALRLANGSHRVVTGASRSACPVTRSPARRHLPRPPARTPPSGVSGLEGFCVLARGLPATRCSPKNTKAIHHSQGAGAGPPARHASANSDQGSECLCLWSGVSQSSNCGTWTYGDKWSLKLSSVMIVLTRANCASTQGWSRACCLGH